MCQPNCRHTVKCKMNGTGYECDLNNDPKESMCDTCQCELDLELLRQMTQDVAQPDTKKGN